MIIYHQSPDLSFQFIPAMSTSEFSLQPLLEFLAMFLGCGYETYEPPLEVSYLENFRPLNLSSMLVVSISKKQIYSFCILIEF